MVEGETDRSSICAMEKGQKRLNGLSEVNHQLRSALVQRKTRIREARAKIERMNRMIAAAPGVEDVTRSSNVADMEDQLLSEEKQKHDMQLELSRKIQGLE